MTCVASTCQLQLAQMAGYKTEFLCTLSENKIFCALNSNSLLKLQKKEFLSYDFWLSTYVSNLNKIQYPKKRLCELLEIQTIEHIQCTCPIFFDFFYMPENFRNLQELCKQYLVECNTNYLCNFSSRQLQSRAKQRKSSCVSCSVAEKSSPIL